MPTITESVDFQQSAQEMAEAVMNRTLDDVPDIEVELAGEFLGAPSMFHCEYYMHVGKEGLLPEALILRCRLVDETESSGTSIMCRYRYIVVVSDDKGEAWRILNPEGVDWYQDAEGQPTVGSLVNRGAFRPRN